MKAWFTSEYEHCGLRTDGERIFSRLIDLARRGRRVLMVGHLLMYHAAVLAMAEQVATSGQEVVVTKAGPGRLHCCGQPMELIGEA